jgi:hypothetical protein
MLRREAVVAKARQRCHIREALRGSFHLERGKETDNRMHNAGLGEHYRNIFSISQ